VEVRDIEMWGDFGTDDYPILVEMCHTVDLKVIVSQAGIY